MPAKQLTLIELFSKSAGKENVGNKRVVSCRSTGDSPERKRLPSIKLNVENIYSNTSTTFDNILEEQNQQSLLSSPLPNEQLDSIFCTLVEPEWRKLLTTELKKEYIKSIHQFLISQYEKGTDIFPPRSLIFNAFNLTPFNEIKVVLLGQDPYHNLSQAHGLCFSVPQGTPPPPSLKNIYKELSSEFPDFKIPIHGELTCWAKQGIFMLNATLTVEAHKPNSHSNIGWQIFTDSVIKLISSKSNNGVVFLLWGGFAHRKEKLVDKSRHRVIKTAHPSPLSVTKFFGSKCFSKTNDLLKELGREPINWNVVLP
ncbi:unnamed protein product [Meloidogyne enterolobii]|uniref:Uncharacterized protein n=1 Tax=Meloidogyne enterolobii TaxID=390850 RepID=A0ACB1AXM1_MELEN